MFTSFFKKKPPPMHELMMKNHGQESTAYIEDNNANNFDFNSEDSEDGIICINFECLSLVEFCL